MYSRDKAHVYYGTTIVLQADPASFVSEVSGGTLAKDSRHVFFNGVVVAGADPKTFRFLSLNDAMQNYAVDKYHVFSAMSDNPDDPYSSRITKIIKLPNSDARTFTWVPPDTKSFALAYAKDKNNVYFLGKILERADAETFISLEYPYGDNQCNLTSANYIAYEPENDDRPTNIDAKDKYRCYAYGKAIPLLKRI